MPLGKKSIKPAGGFARRKGLFERMGLNKKTARLRQFAEARPKIYEELRQHTIPNKAIQVLVHEAGGMEVAGFVEKFSATKLSWLMRTSKPKKVADFIQMASNAFGIPAEIRNGLNSQTAEFLQASESGYQAGTLFSGSIRRIPEMFRILDPKRTAIALNALNGVELSKIVNQTDPVALHAVLREVMAKVPVKQRKKDWAKFWK